MATALEKVLAQIEAKNLGHYKKLMSNINEHDNKYKNNANNFFNKYITYLEKNNTGIEFGVDCYLHMLQDMIEERYKFLVSNKYSNTSFEEVEKAIYGNKDIMTYHMHGLVLAQYLWFDQYERILFFTDNLKKYTIATKKYLEIGGGHGLYMNEAVKFIPTANQFDLVDISESSLTLAKGIIDNEKINYYLKNIFDFNNEDVYDFITMGEVLEHVEEPVMLLKKVNNLLNEDGVCYLTTPINAPMIDHIYLFKNVNEIKNVINAAGLKVMEERVVISEKIAPKLAEKFKAPIMYAAFLKKLN